MKTLNLLIKIVMLFFFIINPHFSYSQKDMNLSLILKNKKNFHSLSSSSGCAEFDSFVSQIDSNLNFAFDNQYTAEIGEKYEKHYDYAISIFYDNDSLIVGSFNYFGVDTVKGNNILTDSCVFVYNKPRERFYFINYVILRYGNTKYSILGRTKYLREIEVYDNKFILLQVVGFGFEWEKEKCRVDYYKHDKGDYYYINSIGGKTNFDAQNSILNTNINKLCVYIDNFEDYMINKYFISIVYYGIEFSVWARKIRNIQENLLINEILYVSPKTKYSKTC